MTETRTLLMHMLDGKWKRLTIPVAAKVTFGHFAPGAREGRMGDNRTLRVYLNKEQQIAVIPGVNWFASLDDVELTDLAITEKGETYWKKQTGEDITEKVINELAAETNYQDSWR